jgi:hypothetical protein
MSNELVKEREVTELLRDLVWLNAVIATELIQITENSSSILRKTSPPDSCLRDHQSLRETALLIAERYRPGTALKEHLTNHQRG